MLRLGSVPQAASRSAAKAGASDIVRIMFGGCAVAGNLLCVACSDARGRVILVDLEERRPVSRFDYTGPGGGYAEAAGIAMDGEHSIFVADPANHVVRRFTLFGKELGHLGLPVQAVPGGVLRDRVGVLHRPSGVAILDDVVHVACGEVGWRHGVQRFHRDGRVMRALLAHGDPERSFGAPRGIAAGPEGVFVADTLHGEVQRFTTQGRYVSSFRVAVGDAEAARPVAVQPLSDGRILVADAGDRPGLRLFGLDGRPLGWPGPEPACDRPQALCRDARGSLYVLDRDGERVQRLHRDLHCATVVFDLAEFLHDF